MKKCIAIFEDLFRKMKFRHKLKKMDDWWYFIGGNCFELFPPSFYYTHSEEEIKRIRNEVLAQAYSMLDQLDSKSADIKKEDE